MSKVIQDKGADIRGDILGTPYAVNGVVDRKRMYQYLAANDLLPTDVTREIEDTFIRVARRELVGVGDLRGAGLVANLGSIGITQYEFERLGAKEAATQSMSISDTGSEDRVTYNLDAVPVPVTRSSFRLDARVQALGSTRGAAVAQVEADESTRQVAKKLEDSLVNGGDAVIGGNTMPGYTTFTARETVTLANNWDAAAGTPIADALAMKQSLVANGFTGPYILYVPSNYDTTLDEDYKDESERTVRERLLSITGITQVKVLPTLADNNVLLVQMTPGVVQIAQGQDISPVTWDIMGGLARRWVVMAIMSFALKRSEDEAGALVSGIAHLS